MDKNYILAIAEHMKMSITILDSLHEKNKQTMLSRIDYFAAERALQVLIESGIGFAKQAAKTYSKAIPSDAYTSFQILHDHQYINEHDLITWRKMIGLRNILVHDYLNIDLKIIDDIIKNRYYAEILNLLTAR